MEHRVTLHASQQCRADAGILLPFYTIFWRHQGEIIVNVYDITPPYAFLFTLVLCTL